MLIQAGRKSGRAPLTVKRGSMTRARPPERRRGPIVKVDDVLIEETNAAAGDRAANLQITEKVVYSIILFCKSDPHALDRQSS